MKNIWILTAVTALYSALGGLMIIATPQVARYLGVSSETLGLIGSGNPIGYALACLLFGQVLARVSGKYVVLTGIACAVATTLLMANANSAAACVVAQIGFGLASGAFWPFVSAWMLDFQTKGISKTRILRHYNMAWTAALAAGQVAGGWLCGAGVLFGTLYAGAAVGATVFGVACLARGTSHDAHEQVAVQRREPLGLPILLAAIVANLLALGTRSTINVNYAELNAHLGFGAERMGLFGGVTILAQFAGFSLGRFYEPVLGLRRVYLLVALSLLATHAAFSFSADLTVLLLAAGLNGLALAVTFQAGIVAATSYFSSPRLGTTFHEGLVGVSTMMPILSGLVIGWMKRSDVSDLNALCSPFYFLAGATLLGLVGQYILVGLRNQQRVLLRSESAGAAGEPAAAHRCQPIILRPDR